jgi:hypothetical protein
MSACPIAFERLVDAFAGELSEADEQVLEAHVFECDVCGEAYARLGRSIGALRSYLPPVISHERLARLRRDGVPLRFTAVTSGTPVAVPFGAGVDLLVHALQGDLRDAERVDVTLESMRGEPLVSLEDVAFDRESGEVLIACKSHYMALGFPAELRFRVRAHSTDGAHEVGEYVVDHLM